MFTPFFFKDIPTITMRDPLARMLGTGGEFTYTYGECVKLAGHSCPTVAGAYLMVQEGIRALYGNEMGVRGEIRVSVKGTLGEGSVGVIATIVSLITGATEASGFHGLGGQFDRRGLLCFDPHLQSDMVLERLDTHERVALTYTPQNVPGDPRIPTWMGMILSGQADTEIQQAFQGAWQERVKQIVIDHRDQVIGVAWMGSAV